MPLAGLPEFDAAFITGTSPKILPLSRIGTQCFAPDNELLRKLMHEHDAMISDYIARYRQR